MGSNQGITNVIEPSEVGDALKHLNDDESDPVHRMTGIDMKTRLHYGELSSILAIDTLVAFKFLPERCLMFTRQKKRLAVSLAGKGRQEIVDIVVGKRDHDTKKGIFGGLFANKGEQK